MNHASADYAQLAEWAAAHPQVVEAVKRLSDEQVDKAMDFIGALVRDPHKAVKTEIEAQRPNA